jgi:hypothetical protein
VRFSFRGLGVEVGLAKNGRKQVRFPFGFAQGQDDNQKAKATATADPYGMTNRKMSAG